DDAGLRLPPLPQEDHVVAGDQRVLELRQHGVLETDDPVDEGLPGGDAGDGVLPHLLLDGAGDPPALAQLSEGSGSGHGCSVTSARSENGAYPRAFVSVSRPAESVDLSGTWRAAV